MSLTLTLLSVRSRDGCNSRARWVQQIATTSVNKWVDPREVETLGPFGTHPVQLPVDTWWRKRLLVRPNRAGEILTTSSAREQVRDVERQMASEADR